MFTFTDGFVCMFVWMRMNVGICECGYIWMWVYVNVGILMCDAIHLIDNQLYNLSLLSSLFLSYSFSFLVVCLIVKSQIQSQTQQTHNEHKHTYKSISKSKHILSNILLLLKTTKRITTWERFFFILITKN